MESFVGRVRSVVYKNEDFHIFSMETSGRDVFDLGRKVTCKGRLFGILGIAPGVPLRVLGTWVTDPKFGRQFDLRGWEPWSDTDQGVESFLTTCMGLDPIRVDLLVQTFSTDLFRVLTEEPIRLLTVPGMSESEAKDLQMAWGYARASVELSEFFVHQDVSSVQMKGVFDAFGAEAKRVLQENPYRLLEIDGWAFSQVDEVADSLGISRTDPRRFEGACLWVLRESSKSGHLFVRRGDFPATLKGLLRNSEVDAFDEMTLSTDLNAAVLRLAERAAVHVDPSVGVYLPANHRHERDAASQLARFLTPLSLELNLDDFLNSYETLFQITLSPDQREAVAQLVRSRVLVLTGLPGTGKTTVIRTIVHLFDRLGITFSLMAPTGIAAKRLSSVTGKPAGTIHRTFRFNGEIWGFDRQNKYPIGAMIVDEMSMVDQELFYRILDALQEGTILVLVGDDAQLSSVGPGNVLREMIRCEAIPTVRLTQIFRQAEASDIILNSHRINRGEGIDSGSESSDFRFLSINDEEKIAALIVAMARKLKGRDANFQVLSPKYEGTVGVMALNDRLREALNPPQPGKKELVMGPFTYREGDRLMVIQNDYDLGVYNGDMGKLLSIHRDHFLVRIHGGGEEGLDMHVEIPRREVPTKLRLAYAITVHKSQGSEFDTVILPIVRGQGRMLQRNLFYTAVTRAKTRVWLLGDSIAVERSIANDQVVQRNTNFCRAVLASVKALRAGGVDAGDDHPLASGGSDGGAADPSTSPA